jgi:predicted amidohydrolase
MRLALMKAVPRKWDLEANLKQFEELLDEADARGAELFVTPECWLDGYAADDKESTKERLREVAQDPERSELLAQIASLASSRGLGVCLGFTSLENGEVHNAAGLWGPGGEVLGIYRKTHLQGQDLQFSPGDDLPVWQTPWGRIGIMICADRRWPEVARVLRLKGARLILTPSYGMRGLENEWWMRTRSYENQCFVAFVHPKVAFVAEPGGRLEASLAGATAGVLVCDVDLSLARDDNHLQDRRPELYRIISDPR